MRIIFRKIRHARFLYNKRNGENDWGARYTLGARYLSKNTVITRKIQHKLLVTQKKLFLQFATTISFTVVVKNMKSVRTILI